MNQKNFNRRAFLKNSALAAAAVALTPGSAFPLNTPAVKNKLSRWKGFNLLDLFSPTPPRNQNPGRTTEEDLKWMADWGFDFVRIPMAYPRYLSFDRTRDIRKDEVCNFDPKVLEEIDQLIFMAHKYNLHVSLNLHRGPGFCINAGFHEPSICGKTWRPRMLSIRTGKCGLNGIRIFRPKNSVLTSLTNPRISRI
jgi:hypothetical protein